MNFPQRNVSLDIVGDAICVGPHHVSDGGLLQIHPGNVKYRVKVSSWNTRKDRMSWIVLSFWQMGRSHHVYHVYRLLMKADLFWEDPKHEQWLLFAIAATNPAQVYDVCHWQFVFWNKNHSLCNVAGSRDRRDHMIRALIICLVRDHMRRRLRPTTPSTLFCMLTDNWNWPEICNRDFQGRSHVNLRFQSDVAYPARAQIPVRDFSLILF